MQILPLEGCQIRGAKVNWETVCLPKIGGGLGIKQILDWNNACVMRVIWLLIIGAYGLRGLMLILSKKGTSGPLMSLAFALMAGGKF